MKNKPENNIDAAMKKAAALLSKRMHSCCEIKSKLSKKFPPQIVEQVLENLRRMDFLNDERFAKSYAEELSSNGIASFAIFAKLIKRGIPKDIAENAAAAFSSPEEEKNAAKKIIGSKMKSWKNVTEAQKLKAKIFRTLKSKGFSNDTIFEIINSEQFNNNDE